MSHPSEEKKMSALDVEFIKQQLAFSIPTRLTNIDENQTPNSISLCLELS